MIVWHKCKFVTVLCGGCNFDSCRGHLMGSCGHRDCTIWHMLFDVAWQIDDADLSPQKMEPPKSAMPWHGCHGIDRCLERRLQLQAMRSRLHINVLGEILLGVCRLVQLIVHILASSKTFIAKSNHGLHDDWTSHGKGKVLMALPQHLLKRKLSKSSFGP